jgi:hypothetical protein
VIVDAYGRDLRWLERAAPKVRPSRWMFFLSIFWPMMDVSLWRDVERMRPADS